MIKSTRVVIDDGSRDNGKVFDLTEMPARRAEKWADRALFALAKSRIDVSIKMGPNAFGSVPLPSDGAPVELPQPGSGMAGMATIGLEPFSRVSFQEDISPLLDELMNCVAYVPDPNKNYRRCPPEEGDIEEVSTIRRLRTEVFNLHAGFSMADTISEFLTMVSGLSSLITSMFRGSSG